CCIVNILHIEFMLEAILETLQEYSLKEVSDKEEKVFKQVQEYLASHDFIKGQRFARTDSIESCKC
ncbi:hypothetical protein, partial [Streptococcus mutans]|uniref:hypothetical protein n=1 Tax=Streptococcus mutans TaxID=1309 RepID=UPI000361BFC8